MPTVRTVTVKSAGGDYSSLSAAEAGEQGDLVSLDRQLDIACYNFADTTAVVIDGSTTDATRYIRIYAVDSHGGVYGTAAYRNTGGGGFQPAINISDTYVRLVGLQISPTSTFLASGIRVPGVGTGVLIDSCVVRLTGATGGNTLGESTIGLQDSGTTIRNCSITGGRCGIYVTGDATIQNCTFGAGSEYGISSPYGTVTVTNCYIGSYSSGAYDFGTFTRTTCAHHSGTSHTGSTANVGYSSSNFVSTTTNSEDLHLAAGASATLKTGGTDLSGTFTTDIDGVTRSGSWSIGADQLVPTTSPTSNVVRSRIFTGLAFGGRTIR